MFVYKLPSHINCSMAECFPEKLSFGLIGVKHFEEYN